MRPAPKHPMQCISDRRTAHSLKRLAFSLLGIFALAVLASNAGLHAYEFAPGANFADPLDLTKLNQAYNAKWNETNTELLKLSVAALKAGVPKEKVEELENELNDLWKATDSLSPDSPIRKVLARVQNPDQGDEQLFMDETNRQFAEFLKKAAEELKPPHADPNAGAQPAPVPAAKPNVAIQPQKVGLPEEFGKFDVLADPTLKSKIESTLSRKFFPDGKPTESFGFDQLIKKDDKDGAVDVIVDYAHKLITSRLKASPGFQNLVKKSGIELNDFLAEVKRRNGDTLKGMGQEIMAALGHVDPKWPMVAKTVWADLGQEFTDKLIELLEKANDRYNEDKDKTIARESKTKRSDRLYKDAVKFVIDEFIVNSEKEIDSVSQSRLKSYALQAAEPMTDGSNNEPGGGEGETEDSTDIDQFKSTVFAKMRLIYKELGGFGNVMGMFGLKGYLAGIIIDALVQRLDRNLSAAERAKAHGWAAELEREFQGDTTPQRPGPVTLQPVPTSPYPQWPVTPMPFVPYSRHMGHKLGHHNRPVMYVMPGMGGYVVMPR